MMEFGIMNNATEEQGVMFGYNVMDAFRRSGKSLTEWTVLRVEFID